MLKTYAMLEQNSPTIFNRTHHLRFRSRAAAGFAGVDFLVHEAGERLAEKLDDMGRQFPRSVYLGAACPAVQLHPKLHAPIHAENCAAYPAQLVVNEEHLPFAAASLDAIISSLHLHWVNDLVGTLIQMRLSLKPDGLLLSMVPGARTLIELREVLLEVGAEHGLAPRLSPLLDIRDAGNLLQRAGFALPTIDSELLTITYETPFHLLRELKAMGQSNALLQRHQGLTTPHFWQAVAARYAEKFADKNGRIPMTVELITLTAWAPDASQPQPAKRGTGSVSFHEALQ